jgi:hypothetical protein
MDTVNRPTFDGEPFESLKRGRWTLHRLTPQDNGEERWSLGVNGPRMYLTCDETTAISVLMAMVVADAASDIYDAGKERVEGKLTEIRHYDNGK